METIYGEKTILVWKDKLGIGTKTCIYKDKKDLSNLCSEDKILVVKDVKKEATANDHLLEEKKQNHHDEELPIYCSDITNMKQKKKFYNPINNSMVSRVCRSCHDISANTDKFNIVKGHSECNLMKSSCESQSCNNYSELKTENNDIKKEYNNIIGNLQRNHASELNSSCIVLFKTNCETSQSSDKNICRICHSDDDELIAPCNCSGSARYVHAKCLVTWFKKTVKNQCELCMGDVKIRKINHRFVLWKKPEDRPVPLIWFTVFFVGLFLNILSIYVNASELCKSTACLIFYVVNGFGILLDAAFLYFWFLKCRHYWKKWCALNQDWYIDDLKDDVDYVKDHPV
ncbi:E3 ubiquitin-protein ligase MARCHF8 isoform X1 [Hydra vulgaris]|uniref:E3 ubiquitin-protein ligase MARCHF8 isoform X1 n=1 Tax=Hydra vulgaris TaxID=6087 RepID=UPI00019277F6|nr:E3 ubiquitin-protein ligase MARCHF8 [Hydra vulgaris]